MAPLQKIRNVVSGILLRAYASSNEKNCYLLRPSMTSLSLVVGAVAVRVANSNTKAPHRSVTRMFLQDIAQDLNT